MNRESGKIDGTGKTTCSSSGGITINSGSSDMNSGSIHLKSGESAKPGSLYLRVEFQYGPRRWQNPSSFWKISE